MMKINLMMMLMLSNIMYNSRHPITVAIVILIQSILTSLLIRFYSQSSWIPLTMFLIMVGGLMVIFMYITSICSNIKFCKLIVNKPIYFILLVITFFKFKIQYNNIDNLQLMDLYNMELYKLFQPLNLNSSLFLFIYLLVMLIIMINLLSKEKGPMRKKY